jgi:hypothetical protein
MLCTDEGVSNMSSAGITSFERRRQRLLSRRRFAGRMLKARQIQDVAFLIQNDSGLPQGLARHSAAG